eukprot:GHVT01028907.1.p1 GENE.GHVT01028907.1~~GHVT01028907.1.p1  ORF type:complete len:181 (+),score=40.36 GHVT01028907.1:216-758(+)
MIEAPHLALLAMLKNLSESCASVINTPHSVRVLHLTSCAARVSRLRPGGASFLHCYSAAAEGGGGRGGAGEPRGEGRRKNGRETEEEDGGGEEGGRGEDGGRGKREDPPENKAAEAGGRGPGEGSGKVAVRTPSMNVTKLVRPRMEKTVLAKTKTNYQTTTDQEKKLEFGKLEMCYKVFC